MSTTPLCCVCLVDLEPGETSQFCSEECQEIHDDWSMKELKR